MVSRAGYLNVGPIINPVDALSGSLQDLSKMYAAQSNKKQANAKVAKEQLYLDNKRRAKRDTNEFLLGLSSSPSTYKIDDYSKGLQKTFKDKSASYDREELALRNYTNTGDEKYLNESLSYIKRAKGEDKSISDEARKVRKQNLINMRFNLKDASDDDRRAALDSQMDNLFSVKREALNRSITSGSSLTKGQRANAVMRNLPESSREYGDASAIRSAVLRSLPGDTEQQLKSDSDANISAFNKGVKATFDQDMKTYQSKIKQYRSSTDYKALSSIFDDSIGSMDDADRKDIVDFLVSENVPHKAIKYIVEGLVETSIANTKSIGRLDSPEVQKVLTAELGVLRANGSLTGIDGIKKPKMGETRSRKNLDEIQRGLLSSNFAGSRRVLDVSQEWRDNYVNRAGLAPADTVGRDLVAPAAIIPASVGKNLTDTMKRAAGTKDYPAMMAEAESSGNSRAVSGQYYGSYQMGVAALKDAGYINADGSWNGAKTGIHSKEEYLASDKAQKDAFTIYSGKNENALVNSGATKWIGKKFKGVDVTMNGLKAAAHLVGASAVAKMLDTGEVPTDGNGTKALSYLQMGSMNTKAAPKPPRLPDPNMITVKKDGVNVRINPDVPRDWDTDDELLRQKARDAYKTATPYEAALGAGETVAAAIGGVPGILGYGAGSVLDVVDQLNKKPYRNRRDELAAKSSFFQVDASSSDVAKRISEAIGKLAPSIPANMSALQLKSILNYGKGARDIGRSLTPSNIKASRKATSDASNKEMAQYAQRVDVEATAKKAKADEALIKEQTEDMFNQDWFERIFDKVVGNPAANAAFDANIPAMRAYVAGRR